VRLILASSIVLLSFEASSASAFCGFYVASTDRELFNHATLVVLMREGTTTVLSMQNDYEGAAEDFALVVPVPVVLREQQVKTLPREVFDRVERMAAPRLVEYWEEDPCAPEGSVGLGSLGAIGRGLGSGSGYGGGAGAPLVVIEAEFAVGEYDIVILSARDSSALETWLRDNGYRMPEGASEALRPYVESGMKFFVAKVDVERVTFESGRAVLSPLRVEYESNELSLPVRLGLLNSSGTQDLIVHVLARNQRFELANYPNVTIPTNLDVQPEARERFGEFYAALFDRTVERNPGAVVTEYAWQAGTCDPCPGDVMLTDEDMVTLGARQPRAGDETEARVGTVPVVRLGAPNVQGPLAPAVVTRVVRRHLNEIRFCYEMALAPTPQLAGRVSVQFEVSPAGSVASASVANTSLGHANVEACMAAATRRWTFPSGDAPTTITMPYTLAVGAGRVPTLGRPDLVSQFVLTRLHYRYGDQGLARDLVFREAEPIVGGRELRGPDGRLEENSRPDSVNNFQARYAIRHPWEDEIACADPVRGRWGGVSRDPGGPSATRTATGLGHAARGNVQLTALLASNVPVLGISGIAPTAPHDGAPDTATESADMRGAPDIAAAAEEPSPPAAGGCGCATGNPERTGLLPTAILAAACALRVWRRRR
jgi:TonB family protein